MSDGKSHLKQRVVHTMREYLVISFYLFVVFSLLLVYKSLVLAQHHIEFVHHGVALLSALALAKVMLTAQELHLADWFGDAPLIYPTITKSLVFTVVLVCFKLRKNSSSAAFTANHSSKVSANWAADHGRAF